MLGVFFFFFFKKQTRPNFDCSQHCITPPSRRLFERTEFRLFDKDIPQLSQHRLDDLSVLFKRTLIKYLIKAKVNLGVISN